MVGRAILILGSLGCTISSSYLFQAFVCFIKLGLFTLLPPLRRLRLELRSSQGGHFLVALGYICVFFYDHDKSAAKPTL